MPKFVGNHLRVSYVFLSSYTWLTSSRNAYHRSRAVKGYDFDAVQQARAHADGNRVKGTNWRTREQASITLGSTDSELEIRDASLVVDLLGIEQISGIPLASVNEAHTYLSTLLSDRASIVVHPAGTKLPARLPLAGFEARPTSAGEPLEWSVWLTAGSSDILPVAKLVANLTDYIENTAPRLNGR